MKSAERGKLDYVNSYLSQTRRLLGLLDKDSLACMIGGLRRVRTAGGRLFVIGIGGSAANASHAVNDFRKIAGVEAYTPCDNMPEFSAWANDSGWDQPFVRWLRESRLSKKDGLVVLSVGGGSEKTSPNIVRAMEWCKKTGATLFSIVSRDGGRAAELSDHLVLIPVVDDKRITPHAEGLQSVLLHLIVNGMG